MVCAMAPLPCRHFEGNFLGYFFFLPLILGWIVPLFWPAQDCSGHIRKGEWVEWCNLGSFLLWRVNIHRDEETHHGRAELAPPRCP